jgi:hypothetical protein
MQVSSCLGDELGTEMQPDHYWARCKITEVYILHDVEVSLKARLENSTYELKQLAEALDLSGLIHSKAIHDLVGLLTE